METPSEWSTGDALLGSVPTLPGMNKSPEMEAGFKRYWDHYRLMQEWMQSYVTAHRRQLGGTPSYHSGGATRRKLNVENSAQQRVRRRRMKTNEGVDGRRGSLGEQRSLSEQISTEATDTADDARSTEFVVEVSEELKDFFLKSQKHREEREKRRLEELKRTEEADGQEGGKCNSTEAPKERPGAKRNQEMKVLYGKYTPMIQGLETAIQMEFDHILDRKQPELWPSIGLNL